MANGSPPRLIEKLESWAPHIRSIVRMMTAFMFMLAGMSKLFAFPAALLPNGGTATFPTQIWFAGVLETCGGALLFVGLFTRPVAFLLSGEMAIAYFQAHFPRSFWPTVNGGVSAVLYCFIWLYISAAGPGPWSLDSWRRRRSEGGVH